MKNTFKILALTSFLWFLPGTGFAVQTFYGTVTGVIDGDSLRVQSDTRSYEVRLYGIDAPEYDQDFASEAKRLVKKRFYKKRVKVIPVEWDKYKRLVAIVEYDENSTINDLLLQSGLAWFYPKYCKKRICGSWKNMAREAREKKLNIWSQSKPVAPWRWKQGKYK